MSFKNNNISKVFKTCALSSALALTGCNISIEKIGDGDVLASEGPGCVKGQGPFFSAILDGATCTSSYGTINPVTFTPVARDGFVFYGWGEECTDKNECTFRPPGALGGTKRLVAFFYPEDVANKLDELNIDDIWVRNCLAEAMVEEGTTDLTQISELSCDVAHPVASDITLDLSGLSHAPNVETLKFYPRGAFTLSSGLTGKGGAKISFANFSLLNDLDNLDSLLLHRADVDPGVITSLDLKDLALTHTAIDDISFLANMPQLEEFSLNGEADLMTAEDLNVLTQLPNLTSLILGSNKIEDSSIIPDLPNLTELWLAGNPITSVDDLTRFANLEVLALTSTNIDNVDAISGLTKMVELELRNTNVAGDLSALSNMADLEVLNITNTDINSLAGLENATKLKNLQAYDFKGTNIAQLANKPMLEQLNLSGAAYGDNVLDISVFASNSYPNLKVIKLDDSAVADATPLGANPLPALEELDLDNNPVSSLGGMQPANVPNLKVLGLRGTHFSDVTQLFGFTQLESLYVVTNSESPERISCEDHDQLVAALPNTYIYSNCPNQP